MSDSHESPPVLRPTVVPEAVEPDVVERIDPTPVEAPDAPATEPAPVAIVRRATTPPTGGTPSLPVTAVDLWRDRLRTTLDRFIYAGGLYAIVTLRLRDKLDVGAVVAILLVCGVRPHTILDALSQRGGAVRAGAGAALPVAGALSWHRFFGSLLVLALTLGVLLNGVAVALPLVR